MLRSPSDGRSTVRKIEGEEIVILLQAWWSDFVDGNLAVRKSLGRRPDHLDDLGDRCSNAVVGVERDAEFLEVDILGIAERHLDDVWIDPVRPGDEGKNQSQIVDVAGHGADLLKGVEDSAEGDDVSGAGDSAGARFDPGHSGPAGGKANASPVVATDVEGGAPRGHDSDGSTTTSSTASLEVAGITGSSICEVVGLEPKRQFGCIGLAE